VLLQLVGEPVVRMIHHFVEGWLYALLTCNLSGSRAKAAMRRTLRHRQSENGIVTAMMTYDNIVSRNPQKLFSITAALSATTIQHQRPSMSFHPTQRTQRTQRNVRYATIATYANNATHEQTPFPSSRFGRCVSCVSCVRCIRCVLACVLSLRLACVSRVEKVWLRKSFALCALR